MKKILFMMAFCLMTAFTFAQYAEDAEKPAGDFETSVVNALRTAYALADYGYANNSATALIEAAEIISKISVQKMDVEKTGSAEAEETYTRKYAVEQLIADGKRLAAGNKTVSKWAAEVEKAINKSVTGTRGSTMGPKYDIDSARPNGQAVRYTIGFDGGRLAEIFVNSMNGCDYDLYVYDQNNKLVVEDSTFNINCYVNFVPQWTGVYYIVVKNRSKWIGAFELITN